jgi:hypothetical protein
MKDGKVLGVARLSTPLTEVESSVWSYESRHPRGYSHCHIDGNFAHSIIANWDDASSAPSVTFGSRHEHHPEVKVTGLEESDEITRLNLAFHSMSAQLQSRIDELTGRGEAKLAACDELWRMAS